MVRRLALLLVTAVAVVALSASLVACGLASAPPDSYRIEWTGSSGEPFSATYTVVPPSGTSYSVSLSGFLLGSSTPIVRSFTAPQGSFVSATGTMVFSPWSYWMRVSIFRNGRLCGTDYLWDALRDIHVSTSCR